MEMKALSAQSLVRVLGIDILIFTLSNSESHLNFDITQPINLGTTNIME